MPTTAINTRPRPSRFRVRFVELQRMKMRKLQIKLVKNVIDMCDTPPTEPETWEETLRDYVQALQDYDYMTECSKRLTDPFLVSGEGFLDHVVLEFAMRSARNPKRFRKQDFDRDPSTGPWQGSMDSTPIGRTRGAVLREARWKARVRNLFIVAFASAFLLAPMWLMVLHRTHYTALISTTAFVIVFGLFMSFYLDKESEVLASTAAYAAVLVVFVGLNVTPLS